MRHSVLCYAPTMMVVLCGFASSDASLLREKQNPISELSEGLILHYSFDSGIGRRVVDLSGMQNDGTLRSGTYMSTGDRVGRVMFFNGETDYVDMGEALNLQTEVFTLALWARTKNIEGKWQTILTFGPRSHAVSILPNGHLYYGWQRIVRSGTAEGSTDVRSGRWVFLTVTRDSDNMVCLYVDGKKEKSAICEGSSEFLYGGKLGGDVLEREYFNGSVDSVRFYNRALAHNEVQALYANENASVETSNRDLTTRKEDIRIDADPLGHIKVSGIVYDGNREPLAGVVVNLAFVGREQYVTDSQGHFAGGYQLRDAPSLSRMLRKPTIGVHARYPGRNLGVALQVPLAKDVQVEIILQPMMSIEGRVTDRNGTPIGGASLVHILCNDSWGKIQGRIHCNARGYFKFSVVRDCFYEAVFRAKGYGIERLEYGTWDEDKNRLNLGNIVLPLAKFNIEGKVVDEAGSGIPNARVYLSGPTQPGFENTRTDSQGRFVFGSLCPGPVQIDTETTDANGTTTLSGHVQGRVEQGKFTIVAQKWTPPICYPPQPAPPSLINRPLPDLNMIIPDVIDESSRGKSILLCFWSLEVQGSRHCVRKLAYMAEMLKKSNVAIFGVMIQGRELVPEFVKQFEHPFPVITVPQEKVRVLVESGIDWDTLPWIILTDSQHVVTEEGFGLSILRNLETKTASRVVTK